MSDYAEFLERKRMSDPSTGLADVPPLNPMLFEFQRDIVTWALKRGRACIFADCGMGKTPMQLEWARHVPGKVLAVILAGQLIVGAVVSLTVKVVVQVELFPDPSVAVSVIVWGPCPTMVPGAGLCVTVTAPQLSAVVAPDLTSGTGA